MRRKEPKIAQQELAELHLLRVDACRTRRKYETARNQIFARLERGAKIEPGPLRAEITVRAKLNVE